MDPSNHFRTEVPDPLSVVDQASPHDNPYNFRGLVRMESFHTKNDSGLKLNNPTKPPDIIPPKPPIWHSDNAIYAPESSWYRLWYLSWYLNLLKRWCTNPGHDPGEAGTQNQNPSLSRRQKNSLRVINGWHRLNDPTKSMESISQRGFQPRNSEPIRGLLRFKRQRSGSYAAVIEAPDRPWPTYDEAASALRGTRPRANSDEGGPCSPAWPLTPLISGNPSHRHPGEASGQKHGPDAPEVRIDMINDDAERIITYQAWKEYIDQVKKSRLENLSMAVITKTTLALAGQAVSAVMTAALASNATSFCVYLVVFAIVFGLSFTLAGVCLHGNRRDLSILMTKIGAIATASAILISLGSHLLPVIGWTVGPMAFLVVTMAVIFAR